MAMTLWNMYVTEDVLLKNYIAFHPSFLSHRMLQHYNQKIVYEVFNLTNAYTINIFLCVHLQFEYVKWRNTVYVIWAWLLLEKYDKGHVTTLLHRMNNGGDNVNSNGVDLNAANESSLVDQEHPCQNQVLVVFRLRA
jgi:hypothetical protein